MIIYVDIIQLVLQLVTGLILITNQIQDADALNLLRGQHFVYWLFTTGLVFALLFIKSYYGFKFLWYSRASYERQVTLKNEQRNAQLPTSGVVTLRVNEDADQIKQRTRKMVLKSQRRQLNSFFIASTVYYIFLLILSMCLIPIVVAIDLIQDIIIFDKDAPQIKLRDVLAFMGFFALIAIISLVYIVKRIMWLLNEKDDELRYRSMKVGEEILKKEDKDD